MQTYEIVWKLVMSTFILGLLAHFIRQWLIERTKRRSPGDQFMTQNEIKKLLDEKCKLAGSGFIKLADLHIRCKECKERIEKERDKEMEHVQELIEKDLEAGRKEFDRINEAQEKMTDTISGMKVTVAEGFADLSKAVENLAKRLEESKA